jgi:hypothetical protein
VGHAVLHALTAHAANHAGQVTVWRRVMGLGVLAEPFAGARPVACRSRDDANGLRAPAVLGRIPDEESSTIWEDRRSGRGPVRVFSSDRGTPSL